MERENVADRSKQHKCICAIDGQILFPPSVLIVNLEIVYLIDSRLSVPGLDPGYERGIFTWA